MLIRGYGLKSANDHPVRDPRDFKLLVRDVMDERPKEEQSYIEVHSATNQSFAKRWQTNNYRLNKSWLVSAIKLDIERVQIGIDHLNDAETVI